jgi:polysaccharide chain length determinant protein (PEP-CTERM system associated)
MSDDYQLTLIDYLMILRRRALIMAGAFVLILAAAIAVALLLPPLYQSTGTILIESPQISSDFIQGTVTGNADERLEVIKQRVMTRENLLRLIDKYQLYKDQAALTPTETIDKMRSHIDVEVVKSPTPNAQRATPTIAFLVSFEHQKPDLALRATNELVTLFLNENVNARTEKASQTTGFLNQEANKIKSELDALEGRIASYKQENVGALPENLSTTTMTQQRIESDIRDNERNIKSAQDDLGVLDTQMASARSSAAMAGSASALSPEQELARARIEYARLSSAYTASHPDVRAAKRRIQTLEAQLASGANRSNVAMASDPVVATLQARSAAIRSRISQLQTEGKALRARLDEVEKNLLRAPQVERGLAILMRDQQNDQKKYEEIRSKLMTAQIAENLEDDKKAERFTLLEPPLMAEDPIKPNRKKIIALGFILAAAGAAGLVMAMEAINGGVRGTAALEAIIHQRPLGSIPYITLQSELERRQQLRRYGVLGLVAVLLAALLSVHVFYMPLDILYLKLITQLR